MKTSFTPSEKATLSSQLALSNSQLRQRNPGPSEKRQPIHTVYGGAQLFSPGIAKKMGDTALRTLEEYAPTGFALARALEIDGAQNEFWTNVHSRVAQKLKNEAVEDFRIDFEDGYGYRPDDEEDGHAESVALALAEGMTQHTLPPFIGIRIKSFSEECLSRSIRTLDIFLSTLLSQTDQKLPDNFVVTLPKVTMAAQMKTLDEVLSLLEKKNRLPPKTVCCEMMVETPQAILDQNGCVPLRSFIEAAQGRCVAAHFGTYDYTAGCDITASWQIMQNPVCDFAKHMMKVTLSGTGIFLSDGATAVLPIGPHKGPSLTHEARQENEAVVHRAWRLSYQNILHSLSTGFYQGWDLHPAQLPIRYAAVYAFFLQSLETSSKRLKGFIDRAAQATLLGDIFDDAATGQGLLNFFLRAVSCGAITSEEIPGLTLQEIQSRSFLNIMHARKTRER